MLLSAGELHGVWQTWKGLRLKAMINQKRVRMDCKQETPTPRDISPSERRGSGGFSLVAGKAAGAGSWATSASGGGAGNSATSGGFSTAGRVGPTSATGAWGLELSAAGGFASKSSSSIII